MMDDFKKFGTRNESSDPLPQAPFSEGGYGFGAIFRLTHRVRGTEYKIGDHFTYISESDSVAADPYILKIGDGIGETCFLDPQGRAVILSADSGVVNTIFEYVQPPQRTVVLEEGEEYTPPPAPPKYITAEQFLEFRKGLATVLTEIAAIAPKTGEQGYQGFQGERGERGERGETGWTGYPGDKGLQGIDGATGSQGPQGERGTDGKAGEQGERGEQGKQGEKGDKGDAGKAGEDGKVGAKGDRGDRGETGLRGATGSAGAKGDQGEPGRTGAKGDRGGEGQVGKDGKDGKDGKAGQAGEVGRRGVTGDSGVITAKFPLVYDAAEKSISIDEARLDKILKKILGGGRVSPQDMGWLASTGGGGKVAVYVNGGKVTPDVRTLDFTGAGVSFDKVGGKVTIKISGSGGSGGVGATGATGATGSQGVQGATGAVGFRYYYNGTGASGSGNPSGNLWFKDGTNSIFINRTTADGIDAWGHFYTWKLLSGWGVDNGMLMIRRYGEQAPMRMVSFSAVGYTGTVSGLVNANNAEYQYTLSHGVVTAGTFTHGETLDVYIMGLQGPKGNDGLDYDPNNISISQNYGTYSVAV